MIWSVLSGSFSHAVYAERTSCCESHRHMAAKGIGHSELAIRKWVMLITDQWCQGTKINEFPLRVKLSLWLACYGLQNISLNQWFSPLALLELHVKFSVNTNAGVWVPDLVGLGRGSESVFKTSPADPTLGAKPFSKVCTPGSQTLRIKALKSSGGLVKPDCWFPPPEFLIQ